MTMTVLSARGMGLAPVLATTVLATTGLTVIRAGHAEECPEATPEPHVLEGDPAPGTGAAFQSFDRPNVSASGRVLFTGETDGASDGDDVVFLGLTLIAREGALAAGTAGVFDAFEFLETAQQVNADGDAVYIATLRGVPETSERVVYRNGTLAARSGVSPRGIPDRVFVDFGFAGVTDDGVVGFAADLDGTTDDDSIIVLADEVLYRQGDPVPGLDDETWDGDFGEVQWNGRGDVLFRGNTTLPTSGDVVLFRRLANTGDDPIEEIVAREGQTIETRGGTGRLDDIVQSALASDGGWALRGTLEEAPATEDGVILSAGGFTVREGDPVADLPGVRLGDFGGLDVNGAGDVVYLADLVGDTPPDVSEGIFVNGCLLVTDGAPAPGLPAGTLLVDLGFEDVFVNDRRELVFAAAYAGTATGDGLFTIALPVACPGDVDGSGAVDVRDVVAVLAGWGPCPKSGPCPSDLDGDGVVGERDLLTVLTSWGPCP
jgi:hypothetical protein